MLGRAVDIVTGKEMDGTSHLNAMQYTRGAPGE